MVTLLGFKVDDSGREKYNKGIDQAKQKQQSFTASMLKANLIMGAATKIIGGAFSFVRDSVIGATAETERYRVSLGTMMGDQEKANKIIHDLDYSAVSDFYGTAAAIGGLQNMVTFGMKAEEASEMLTRIGDIAQGSGEAFQSMSANLGQVFTKGKADAMDLKQFAAQGFDVVGEVAKASGKSREEVQKMGVTYEQTKAALTALTSEGGKYNGMLEKQANTLGGILKQFASLKAASAEAIGNGVSDELKDLLKYILEIGRAGQEAFVGKFVSAIKEVIHWIFQIIIMWKVLCYRLADMGDALAPVKQFFIDLKDAAGNALTGIMILAVELGRLIVAAFKPIQAFASPVIKELGAIAKDVFTAIANAIRPLVPVVADSAGFFGLLGKAVAALLRPALKVALAIKGITIALGAYKAAMGVAKTASFIFSGDLAKMAAGFAKLTGSGQIGKGIADTFGLLTGKLSVMKKAAEGNRVALMMLEAQTLKAKAAALAHAVAVKISTAAMKAWDWLKTVAGIVKSTAALVANKIATIAVSVAQRIAAVASSAWAAIQSVLNAVMAANPIGLIILAVFALIAAVILVIKHWRKIVDFFKFIGKAIAGFFVRMWEAIVGFFKKYGEIILQILAIVIFGIPGIIAVAIRQIIKHWDVIGPALKKVLDKVKDFFIAFGNKVTEIFSSIIEKIKTVFAPVGDFFAGLWKSVVSVAKNIWNTLTGWFIGLIDKIKSIWNSIIAFFKKWGMTILKVLGIIIFGIPGLIVVAVKQIIKHWSVIGPAIKKIFDRVMAFFLDFGRKAAQVFWAVVEKIKTVFAPVGDFFANLWEGIISVAINIWDTLKGWFTGLIENIKAIWSGITGFFSGLWEAIKQGPAAAIDYIKNAFFGLFDTIQQKMFGFINKIKEGWESVKGFFGGIGDGVVNFFTGGNSGGTGGGQLQPAYAGASQEAMASTVGQTSNYAYNSAGGGSTVNANTAINVNVPQGTSQEQSESIARQINAQFDAKLAGSINSSRANIPSPEVRRH